MLQERPFEPLMWLAKYFLIRSGKVSRVSFVEQAFENRPETQGAPATVGGT